MKDLLHFSEIIEQEIGKLSYPKNPKSLYMPIQYIMGLQGKRMRPTLVLMAHQLFNENIDSAIFPAIALELFHNFTLLHDDIMDNAPLRRGNPTVHEKWNQNTAILSGDVMLIQAYQQLAKVDSCLKEILDVFNKMAVKVCEGQQWDMDFENQKDVTLSEYMKMIEYKTAALMAASLKIGSITGGASNEEQNHLYKFGLNMGIAFQLKDDLLDVFGSPETFGKQVGGDILACKKTFLYLKAIQLADDLTKSTLENYYRNKDCSIKKVKVVKDIFQSLNIEKHTVEIIKSYYIKATKHLEVISSKNKEILFLFSKKLMERVS